MWTVAKQRPAPWAIGIADAMLLTRHSTAKAAALRISLEVGETWDASDTERAFNFKKRWVDLITKAPRGTHEHYEMLGAQIAAKKAAKKGWP